MARLKEWVEERKQVLMTNLVNRSFKRNPGFVDRLALRMIERAAGPIEDDPELEHER